MIIRFTRFSARIKDIFLFLCFSLSLSFSSLSFSQDSILVLGDSLSAAYGIPIEKGWVTLLQQKLNASNRPFKVVNASISGMTSLEGATEIKGLLTKYHPKIVILGLGSNDGLRGLSINALSKNLSTIIEESQRQKAKVLLIAFVIPTNYGVQYRKAFENVYQNLSKKYALVEVPFLLKEVALNPKLMQEDRLHPNEAAQPILLETVWPYLEKLLGN